MDFFSPLHFIHSDPRDRKRIDPRAGMRIWEREGLGERRWWRKRSGTVNDPHTRHSRLFSYFLRIVYARREMAKEFMAPRLSSTRLPIPKHLLYTSRVKENEVGVAASVAGENASEDARVRPRRRGGARDDMSAVANAGVDARAHPRRRFLPTARTRTRARESTPGFPFG